MGELLGQCCTEYLHTSTAMVTDCDVLALRLKLAALLEVEIGQVCVWGELMCNPNFYGYKDRGLDGTWICFGVIAALPIDLDTSAISQKLAMEGIAHSISGNGQFRLVLCPALRDMLTDVGAVVVA